MRLLTKIGLGVAGLLVLSVGTCSLVSTAFEEGSDGTIEQVASITTNWHWFTPNDKIIIDAFDDPLVKGVSCHVARAQTGGFWYLVGMSEDPADASVACRQTGQLVYDIAELKKRNGEKVFRRHTSILFKTLQVRRILDEKRSIVVYVTNSDTLLGGSGDNSLSSVPLQK